jgi:hypothetical protein
MEGRKAGQIRLGPARKAATTAVYKNYLGRTLYRALLWCHNNMQTSLDCLFLIQFSLKIEAVRFHRAYLYMSANKQVKYFAESLWRFTFSR